MRWWLVLLAGCAEAGGSSAEHDAAIDAASIDAPPDAPPPCTEITTELLQNGAFDASPMGTMWNQTPIDPAYPLITDQGVAGGPASASNRRRIRRGSAACRRRACRRPTCSGKTCRFRRARA